MSLQELVSGLEQAQQGHSGRGNRTATGGCNQSSQACAPGPPQWASAWGWGGWGGNPTRPSGASSQTRHPRHQRQTQSGSCSAGNFIKRGLGMRTKAPTGQGTRAQDACEETPPPGNRLRVPRVHQPGHRPSASSPSTVPGLLLARQAGASSASRTGLSGRQAAEDTGQGQPVSAVSPAVPVPRFLQETASVPGALWAMSGCRG